MTDPDRLLFERAADRFDPPIEAWESLLLRRDRRQRNQRIVTTVVALLLAVLAIGGALRVISVAQRQRPAGPGITPQNVGDLSVDWRTSIQGPSAGLSVRRATTPGEFPGPVINAPVVADGHVFVATQSGVLFAYAASCESNGSACRPAWSAAARASITYPPAVAGGVVYLVTNAGELLAFAEDCDSGGASCQPLWTGRIGGRPTASPVVAGGRVYLVDHLNAEVSAFGVECGANGSRCDPVWVGKAGPAFTRKGRTRPGAFVNEHSVYGAAVAGGVVYVVGTTHQLYALDAATGRRLWVGKTPYRNIGGTRFNTPAVSDGRVFVEAGTTLYAYPLGCRDDGGACRPLWTGGTPDSFTMTQPLVVGNAVLVGSATNAKQGHVVSFAADCRDDGRNCRPAWVGTTDGEATTTYPVADAGVAYMNSFIRGYADAFDLSCRGRCPVTWRATTDATAAGSMQPLLASGGLVFLSDLSGVEAFGARCGTEGGACQPLWKWTAPDGIASTPTIAGDQLFVVTSAGDLFAFSPAGAS